MAKKKAAKKKAVKKVATKAAKKGGKKRYALPDSEKRGRAIAPFFLYGGPPSGFLHGLLD